MNEFYIEVSEFIKSSLDNRLVFDDESKEQILHYLDVDEYEMAYEGFLIEIHNHNAYAKFDGRKIISYAQRLNLKNNGCFDAEIFQKISDAYSNTASKSDFYETLIQVLNIKVPEFKSEFDADDGIYPVLGEFGRFVVEKIDDESIRSDAQDFINSAITQGGAQTEDAIVIQVFQQFYLEEEDVIAKLKSGLNEKALSTFEKYRLKFDHSEDE